MKLCSFIVLVLDSGHWLKTVEAVKLHIAAGFWFYWNGRILSFHFWDQPSKLDFLLTIQFSY